jgi:hypothetical protein
MSLSRRAHVQIASIALIVAVLGVANWIREPTRWVVWLVSIAFMAAIWIVVLARARTAAASQNDSERSLLVASAIMAGLLLAASLALALVGEFGLADQSLRVRAQGVVMGLVVIAMGNFLPKFVPSLAPKRYSAARAQSAQRFAGWTFVLAGLGYAGAWIFLEPAYAGIAATATCATAAALIFARTAWMRVSRDDTPSPT